jgi:para-nitrobenzyl esterase
MSAAWAEFARSGRPWHADLPSWPAYTSDERALMLFDYPCRIARNYDIPLLTVLPGR